MRQVAPIIFLFIALISSFFVFLGDDSLEILRSVEKSLNAQKVKNERLDSQVKNLRSQVRNLSESDRALEKAARNELGLARPNELIFFFNDEPSL